MSIEIRKDSPMQELAKLKEKFHHSKSGSRDINFPFQENKRPLKIDPLSPEIDYQERGVQRPITQSN